MNEASSKMKGLVHLQKVSTDQPVLSVQDDLSRNVLLLINFLRVIGPFHPKILSVMR